MSAEVPGRRSPRRAGTTVDDTDALRRSPRGLEGNALPPGTCLGGRYTIESHLGAGGMGTVYAAYDAVAEHPVALKFIHPDLASDSRASKRIRAELKAALAVSHPNVARTHTLEELDGHTFLVMERLDGPTLAARLEEGRVPFAEAFTLARGILAGVAAAHQRGVVHRDLKPLNIKVCPGGRAVVMDFGLAVLHERRPLAPGARTAHTLAGGGTPGYMAPEVAAGASGDERSDVYALGVTLFELFAGHSPLATAETLEHSDDPALAHAAPRLGRRTRDVPSWLEALLRELLAGDPARRPANAAEALERLERDGKRAAERRRALVAAGLAALAILATVGLVGRGKETPAPRAAAPVRAAVSLMVDAAPAQAVAPAVVPDAAPPPAEPAAAPPVVRKHRAAAEAPVPDRAREERRKRLYLDD